LPNDHANVANIEAIRVDQAEHGIADKEAARQVPLRYGSG
jgi:hypothetical protein